MDGDKPTEAENLVATAATAGQFALATIVCTMAVTAAVFCSTLVKSDLKECREILLDAPAGGEYKVTDLVKPEAFVAGARIWLFGLFSAAFRSQ